jgi:phenylacetic acid degradation operon negative regulatory protein
LTSPQHLRVTILGDYWKGRTDHIPSAAPSEEGA